MEKKIKVGLLPLYISLYHVSLRKRLEPFYETIASLLEEKGLEVVRSEFCMEEPDFEKAIAMFEQENCDCLVTLHMAYSPALKSSEALKKTKLPIVICDTTETFDFSDEQSPVEISYCHGIHGVMDMCNLLKKNGKTYAIAAGHYEKSNVLDRVVGFVKAAKSAQSIKGANVGSIGGYFDGMGDFRVEDSRMKELFGATVVYPEPGELAALEKTVTAEEIEAEKKRNEKDFEFIGTFTDELYNTSITTDLTVRKWMEKKNLRALTINFRELGDLITMPFNAGCRAMEDGYGYAGEGDTLTALFTGGLLQGYPETSFVELFCPDWKNDTVFISHMGEMNYRVADKKPVCFEKYFGYGKGVNPIACGASFKPGDAVFINIYEDMEGFHALLAPVRVVGQKTDSFKKDMRGWLDFSRPLPEVLERISECGATHHSILVYNTTVEEMAFFAKLMHIQPITL